MGRPSSYSTEAAEIICALLAQGHSLRTICAADDAPDKSTVLRWLHEYPDFRDQYARARELQADALVDEMVQIADDANETKPGVEKAKLQIEARKWFAGKVRPKVWGEPERGPSVAVQINNEAHASRYLPPPP